MDALAVIIVLIIGVVIGLIASGIIFVWWLMKDGGIWQ